MESPCIHKTFIIDGVINIYFWFPNSQKALSCMRTNTYSVPAVMGPTFVEAPTL